MKNLLILLALMIAVSSSVYAKGNAVKTTNRGCYGIGKTESISDLTALMNSLYSNNGTSGVTADGSGTDPDELPGGSN